MKKKVMIIAYHFPPLQAIGSQRPYGLAKYLPRFGWEPIILTIKRSGNSPFGIKVIATDYTDRIASIKKAIGFNSTKGVHEQLGIPETKNFDYSTWRSGTIKFWREIVAFPDRQKGWYKYAVKAASDFMDKEKVNAVISTSFPVTAHLIARTLKLKYGVPWVADFRDLWTQNHYHSEFNAVRLLQRRLELKTISDADMLVTVSEPLADNLKELHGSKDVFCVTNGFDSEDSPTASTKLTAKFTITYTGQLYNGKRDPSMLLETVAKLIKEGQIDGDLIEVRFFGLQEAWLTNEIRRHGLERVATVYGLISREEALKKQRESQLLLLLLWNNKNEKGVYTGKIFEYLGSKRPIVAIGGSESVVKDLLDKTHAGRYAGNNDELETIIMQYYSEFVEFGETKYAANGNVGDYMYDSIAKRYSDLLNNLCCNEY